MARRWPDALRLLLTAVQGPAAWQGLVRSGPGWAGPVWSGPVQSGLFRAQPPGKGRTAGCAGRVCLGPNRLARDVALVAQLVIVIIIVVVIMIVVVIVMVSIVIVIVIIIIIVIIYHYDYVYRPLGVRAHRPTTQRVGRGRAAPTHKKGRCG